MLLGNFGPSSVSSKATTNVIVVCFRNITHTQWTGQNRVKYENIFVWSPRKQSYNVMKFLFIEASSTSIYTTVSRKRKRQKRIYTNLQGKELNNLLLLILTIVL